MLRFPGDRHAAAQRDLRAISSRASITASRFTNHYEWGDFKGDPLKLMERWFDLHLYLSNWGTRRLMVRLPAHLLDRKALRPFLRDIDWVEVRPAGDRLIVDILREEEAPDFDAYDEGDYSGRLGELAQLRASVASGDLRLFYLVWLMAVQDGEVGDDIVEPLSGIAPLDAALRSFAGFGRLDPDLVQAAAERGSPVPGADDLRRTVTSLAERDKVALLLRVAEGDARVGGELVRQARSSQPTAMPSRTAGALRARSREIAAGREAAEAKRREVERRRKEQAARAAQRARFDGLRKRGAAVWTEIDSEIARRNPKGYDRAAELLSDLQALAAEDGTADEFAHRVAAIRATHPTKGKFIERLDKLGL